MLSGGHEFITNSEDVIIGTGRDVDNPYRGHFDDTIKDRTRAFGEEFAAGEAFSDIECNKWEQEVAESLKNEKKTGIILTAISSLMLLAVVSVMLLVLHVYLKTGIVDDTLQVVYVMCAIMGFVGMLMLLSGLSSVKSYTRKVENNAG